MTNVTFSSDSPHCLLDGSSDSEENGGPIEEAMRRQRVFKEVGHEATFEFVAEITRDIVKLL